MAATGEHAARQLSFGLCLPTFASPGPALFRVPAWDAIDAKTMLAAAVHADQIGFDAVWVADHYMIGKDDAVFDGWTTLAAVAGATQHVRLCLIQQSMLFRHAPQYAKMIATLDHLSGGRVTMFSNFGHAEREHRAYGFPWFDQADERFARFSEGLEVMQALWTRTGPVDHAGQYFTLEGATANPKPVQPTLPLWFAGSEQAIYDLTARVGHGWNTPPITLTDFRQRRCELERSCKTAGRSIEDITLSLETQILVRTSIEELRETLRQMLTASGTSLALIDVASDPFLNGKTDRIPDALTDYYFVGTPDMVRQQMSEFIAAGIDSFGLWFMDFPSNDSIDLFRREVMDELRATFLGGKNRQ